MRTPHIVLCTLATALVLVPGAAADCPPYPQHCARGSLALLGDTTMSIEAYVEAEATAGTHPGEVRAGGRGHVVVDLSIQSGGRAVEATVIVNETADVDLESPSSQADAVVAPGGTQQLRFPFAAVRGLPAGRTVAIPLVVLAEGGSRAYDVLFPVAPAANPPIDRAPKDSTPGAPLALVLAGLAALAVATRRR